MSNTLTLIVRPRTDATKDDVLRDAVAITGGRLVSDAEWDADEYAIRTDGPTMWIDLAAGYDDEGIPDPVPLGRFPWHFSIDKPSVPKWLDVAMKQLRDLFDGFVHRGRYECILTEIERENILASNVDGYDVTETD
jgi:hypothetical protein